MIRFAKPGDAASIAVIHVETWRKAYDGIVPAPVMESLSVASRAEEWRRAIQADPRQVLVAESKGRIVGWIAVGPCRDADARTDAEVYAVYVRPASWGAGAGRALMARAEEELWNRGFPSILLWVLERNERAREFYDRLGYAEDRATKELTLGEAILKEIRYRKGKPTNPED